MSDDPKADDLTQAIIENIKEKGPQNVKQLTALVAQEFPLTEEKILDTILKLNSQGKIKLDNQPLPNSQNMMAFMKTGQALWYWVTIAVATVTAAIVFLDLEGLYPWSLVRNALGIVFVLWLPGYTLTKALFPTAMPIKTSVERLETIERIALSLGTSLAIVPIIALLLYYTPWGENLTSAVLTLFVTTVVFATAAIAREYQTRNALENQSKMK